MTLIRTSALESVLDKLRSGYYFLVDKAADDESKKLPVENIFPFIMELKEIGVWDMSQNLSTTITILNPSEVLSIKVLNIKGNDGYLYDANSLFDSYLHQSLSPVGSLTFPLVETSTSLAHNHTIPERIAPATAGFQGRNVAVMAELNISTGVCTLQHNMPGGADKVGSNYAYVGQLTNFSGVGVANRGYVLILRQITA